VRGCDGGSGPWAYISTGHAKFVQLMGQVNDSGQKIGGQPSRVVQLWGQVNDSARWPPSLCAPLAPLGPSATYAAPRLGVASGCRARGDAEAKCQLFSPRLPGCQPGSLNKKVPRLCESASTNTGPKSTATTRSSRRCWRGRAPCTRWPMRLARRSGAGGGCVFSVSCDGGLAGQTNHAEAVMRYTDEFLNYWGEIYCRAQLADHKGVGRTCRRTNL
jgi:hypothetical protein